MRPSRHALWSTVAAGLVGCAGGRVRATQAPASQASTDHDTDSDDEDGDETDTPDKPVPVAGAYLTCVTLSPKPDSDQIEAGCVLRDTVHDKKLKFRDAASAKWKYLKPDDVNGAEVLVSNLAAQSDDYYFHAIYRFKFTKSNALNLQGADAQALVEKFSGVLELDGAKGASLTGSSRQLIDSFAASSENIPASALSTRAADSAVFNPAPVTERPAQESNILDTFAGLLGKSTPDAGVAATPAGAATPTQPSRPGACSPPYYVGLDGYYYHADEYCDYYGPYDFYGNPVF